MLCRFRTVFKQGHTLVHRRRVAALVTTAFSRTPTSLAPAADTTNSGQTLILGLPRLQESADQTWRSRARCALQGRSFACLPQLRELRIEAEVSVDDSVSLFDIGICLELAGLPPGLEMLEV